MELIWKLVWLKWLWSDYFKCYATVIKVKGWRTAIVEWKGCSRMTISPCFLWFK